jgi:hypothetical protein
MNEKDIYIYVEEVTAVKSEFTTTTSALSARAYFEVEDFFVFKTHLSTRGVVIFYSAGVVTHDCKIGSWYTYIVYVPRYVHCTYVQLYLRCRYLHNH